MLIKRVQRSEADIILNINRRVDIAMPVGPYKRVKKFVLNFLSRPTSSKNNIIL